ncbi:MAG: hypothetical protein RIF36_26005 [Imperialibacter sp.]|uniref:WapI family immunity protein n=1 Tax=Imperialibacter sp. TaxID=2038411 RepID=UPI0032EB1071
MALTALTEMTIQGIKNQSVELRIASYQYPYTLDRDYDGNWLNIYLSVNSQQGNWQTIDPSLLTWEVEELAGWLLDLSDNREPKYRHLEFIEPNISFKLLNDFCDNLKQLRIHFKLESRPRSAAPDEEFFVDFEADGPAFLRMASELSEQLRRYTVRK